MPNDKLSAKEAALLAQVRVALGKNPVTQADTAVPQPGTPGAPPPDAPRQALGRIIASAEGAAPVARARPAAPLARAERTAPVAAIEIVSLGRATRAPAIDPAIRAAALMAAARAESERLQQQRRQFQVWVPLALISAVGLWALLWLWHRL